MQKSSCFEDILADLEESNSRSVQARAVMANRIAKIALNGTSRRKAYACKSAALLHGIDKFPREYRIARFEQDGEILALNYRDRPALHIPTSEFASAGARRWVEKEKRRGWGVAATVRGSVALDRAA